MCHFSPSAEYPGEVLFRRVLDASHVKISLSMRPPEVPSSAPAKSLGSITRGETFKLEVSLKLEAPRYRFHRKCTVRETFKLKLERIVVRYDSR